MINNIIVPDSKSYMDDKQVQAICIAFANGSVLNPHLTLIWSLVRQTI